MPIEKNQQLDLLCKAVLSLNSTEECYRFFEDLCTIREIQTLAQRMQVAQMLDHGFSYQKTIASTGASSATISRVKRCLDYGSDGYRIVLDRLNTAEKDAEQ